eukprot:3347082-Rhodomonas_salina.2
MLSHVRGDDGRRVVGAHALWPSDLGLWIQNEAMHFVTSEPRFSTMPSCGSSRRLSIVAS